MPDWSDDSTNSATAGVRDTPSALARALADEAAAVEARNRLRQHGLPSLTVTGAVRTSLKAGERVVGWRPSVTLTRHCHEEPDRAIAGRLYLTTDRLILQGREVFAISLAEISELAVVGEHLLITLLDDSGVSIGTTGPRLLRVEVAASVAAARS